MKYQTKRHLIKNEIIYHESEKSHSIYYLEVGTVRVYKAHPSKSNYFTLQIIQEGNFFGYNEVFTKERIRMSSAAVNGQYAVVEKYRINDFYDKLIEDKEFFFDLFLASSNYRKQLWDRHYVFEEYNSFRKIAWILMRMASPADQNPEILEIRNYTHLLLGQYTGSSRQTITSVLNQYRKMGIIEYNRKQIIIKKSLMLQLIK